jgi:hypothetical protein
MSSERERALVPVLLALTAVTGLVDAASVLGLGRVAKIARVLARETAPPEPIGSMKTEL